MDEVVRMYRKDVKSWYPLMVEQIMSKEAYYQVTTTSDLAPAVTINDATGVPYGDIRTPFNQRILLAKRAMGFSVDRMVLERDLYGVFAERGRWLTRSVERSIEIDTAGFLVNATTGNITTPDGVAIASTAHLYSLGVYSNILTGNSALSVSSLEQAQDEIALQPTDTGEPTNFTGPFDLWVAPQQRGLAARLAGTTPNDRRPQTNQNDRDVAGQNIRRVIVNPYWQSTPFAWALLAADAWQNPFYIVRNSGMFLPTPQYDMDKDVYKGTAISVWGKGMRDPRGWIYSAGS